MVATPPLSRALLSRVNMRFSKKPHINNNNTSLLVLVLLAVTSWYPKWLVPKRAATPLLKKHNLLSTKVRSEGPLYKD